MMFKDQYRLLKMIMKDDYRNIDKWLKMKITNDYRRWLKLKTDDKWWDYWRVQTIADYSLLQLIMMEKAGMGWHRME